jgi:Eco57I restriction-modification methylase/N-6 DNA Methylase
VAGAGQGGGTGAADLAMGWWRRDGVTEIAQVLCEFKDIRSGLDAPQHRKGNDRSPVKQCFDYLKHEFDRADVHLSVKPSWGIVTDMNEFRLYARKVGDSRSQRFVLKSLEGAVSLVDSSDEAAYQRFLFARLFSREMLLAESGESSLAKVLDGQWVLEREFEREFYREYQQFREAVFRAIVAANPGFSGTRGKLVKLTQRFLDRCIFILFCEDMGHALEFPTDLLRTMLVERSNDTFYDADSDEVWSVLKRLFRAMRDGGPFPPSHTISRFNGGLFEELPELESLVIPNRVFCARGQGQDAESLSSDKSTLLYFSAHYNFGAHGVGHQRTITLYALGRIFEQSITDLEYMEAEAEERESIASLTKRKRDGVYYTPEWVTAYLVRETIGARLDDIRHELGLQYGRELPENDIQAYRSSRTSGAKRPPKNAATRHLRLLDDYEETLGNLRVVDPACGSGAFLIQALQFLLAERSAIAQERARIAGTASLFDDDASAREILANSLYGVDINPESVEITQLALWLNTASPGKPLGHLDAHIRCGNSLVGRDFADFWQRKHPGSLFANRGEQELEDVNAFDWAAAFPEVLNADLPDEIRGFDCVIGNPPYVKLQHFRRLEPDQSDYYIKQQKGTSPLYESAQTGNFDLYLPFVEKGLSVLNGGGYMGFIAPSLWLKNQYGLGLRRKVKRDRSLDRWVDFKSYQVFDEATTYTALQFFRGRPSEAVRFVFAPDGEIAAVDWDAGAESVAWDALADDDAWNLAAAEDAALIARLAMTCKPLGHEANTRQIFQGLITSADIIYHLKRRAPGRYCQQGSKADGIEYEIEDAIMHPLVSGQQAKRYQRPSTETYILFPYTAETSRLFTAEEMRGRFPKAWEYLRKHEAALRARERGSFDDDRWYRFGRNQSIDKQELAKLGVAQTVPGMRVFADPDGEFYLNNVRVNGILPVSQPDLLFLLGALNSKVVDFVFRRTAKPKGGGYFEANKQFIAPLPIPVASDVQRADVAKRAKLLHALHTERRDRIVDLQLRLESRQCVDERREFSWLWADVGSPVSIAAEAPATLTGRERVAWAGAEHGARLDAHVERIDAMLRPGARLSVANDAGEVRFLAEGVPVVTVYEDEVDSAFLSAQWRQLARTTNVTDRYRAKSLVKSLLGLRSTQSEPLRKQVVDLDAHVVDLDVKIEAAEREMNEYVNDLYGLTEGETRLVEA